MLTQGIGIYPLDQCVLVYVSSLCHEPPSNDINFKNVSDIILYWCQLAVSK